MPLFDPITSGFGRRSPGDWLGRNRRPGDWLGNVCPSGQEGKTQFDARGNAFRWIRQKSKSGLFMGWKKVYIPLPGKSTWTDLGPKSDRLTDIGPGAFMTPVVRRAIDTNGVSPSGCAVKRTYNK